jgi:hypothetical protein
VPRGPRRQGTFFVWSPNADLASPTDFRETKAASENFLLVIATTCSDHTKTRDERHAPMGDTELE